MNVIDDYKNLMPNALRILSVNEYYGNGLLSSAPLIPYMNIGDIIITIMGEPVTSGYAQTYLRIDTEEDASWDILEFKLTGWLAEYNTAGNTFTEATVGESIIRLPECTNSTGITLYEYWGKTLAGRDSRNASISQLSYMLLRIG